MTQLYQPRNNKNHATKSYGTTRYATLCAGTTWGLAENDNPITCRRCMSLIGYVKPKLMRLDRYDVRVMFFKMAHGRKI